MKHVLLYLLLINAAGFLLMHMDKQRARKNRWRISENTLMTVAALGGSIGSLVGMFTAHHKTRHSKFSVGIPVILALQVIVLCLLLAKNPGA